VFLPERLGWSAERQEQVARRVGLSPYQVERIRVFFDSDRDPLNSGWNKRQSEIAVGSGGFWGRAIRRAPSTSSASCRGRWRPTISSSR